MAADERSFDVIAKALDKLVENQEKMQTLESKVASVVTDLDWLKKFFWIAITPISAALIAAVLALIFKQ
jgi:hypothetical protein